MANNLYRFVKNQLCHNDEWHVGDTIKDLISNSVRALPKRTVSQHETRYPRTPEGMRAFLMKFFSRHYLQLQTCLMEFLCSDEFVFRLISNRRLRILDVGAGPAVLGLAVADMVKTIMDALRELKTPRVIQPVRIDYILNDTERICILTGKHLLKRYLSYPDVARSLSDSVVIDVAKEFPANVPRLSRIGMHFGGYDLISFSYVVGVLNETVGFESLIKGMKEIGTSTTPGGRVLILQDKFQSTLMSKLAQRLYVGSRTGECQQELFSKDSDRERQTYSFRYCLYTPVHMPRAVLNIA